MVNEKVKKFKNQVGFSHKTHIKQVQVDCLGIFERIIIISMNN